MYRNVVLKLMEAQDISIHLQPLQRHLQVDLVNFVSNIYHVDENQEMKKTEYCDLRQTFPVLLPLLCLIYSNSPAYAKPVRIITLIKVCNCFARH